MKTINPEILLKSDFTLVKMHLIKNEMGGIKHVYKGIASSDMVNYLNIFPSLNINITEEAFYKFHYKNIFDDEILDLNNLPPHMTFEYFYFFIKHKNFDQSINFSQIFEIGKIFKEGFKAKFLNCIIKNNISDTVVVPYRYDQIFEIMNHYHNDDNFMKICESLLNQKLEKDLCSLDNLVYITDIYVNKLKLSHSILHFIAYSCYENLKLGVSLVTFDKDIILFYRILCECSQLLGDNSETLMEFFAEFKSCLYHNSYVGPTYNYNEEEDLLPIDTLLSIKRSHMLLKERNSSYFDISFDNYLSRTINLNKSLLTIL